MSSAHFVLKTVIDADPLEVAQLAFDAGDFSAVESACRERLRKAPDDAHALYLWGCSAARLGRQAVALEVLNRASRLAPGEVAVLIELARVIVQMGRVDEALRLIDRALLIKPDLARLHFLRAHCQRDLGQTLSAIASLRQAVLLDPVDAASWLNLGNLLRLSDQASEAVDCYDKALAVAPGFVEAWINRGVALGDQLQHEAALESFRRARDLAISHPEADYNEALLRLQVGDYASAWPLFESRWHRTRLAAWKRRLGPGLWRGEPLSAGTRLLVYAEQGRGDALQFARYLPLLARSGARITVALDRSLVQLFSALPGVSAVVALEDSPAAYDLHVSIASLPGIFKTTLSDIPLAQGYLSWPNASHLPDAHDDEVRRPPVVGLVWRGSPRHANDSRRSLPLSTILTALPETIEAVCLQSQPTEEERALLRMRSVRCFETDASDFSETAIRLAQTNLLLTVDTAVAHLAGALGHRAWVLLPFNPDWRWLLYRDDSPWYQSVRLFRQSNAGDWSIPLRRAHDELLTLQATLGDRRVH